MCKYFHSKRTSHRWHLQVKCLCLKICCLKQVIILNILILNISNNSLVFSTGAGPDIGGQISVGIADGQLLSCEQHVFLCGCFFLANVSNKTSFDKVHNASDIDVFKQIQTDNDNDYDGNVYK